MQREQERENVKARRKAQDDTPKQLNAGQKRKRSDAAEEDPKLKEFLEVMQPGSKSKNWASHITDDPTIQPPMKIQAIEVPEAESDEEYEAVPKKPRQKSPPKHTVPSTVTSAAPTVPAVVIAEVVVASTAPDATDDDWLRGRTNRLLDLMDPEDIPAITKEVVSADNSVIEIATEEPTELEDSPVVEESHEEHEHEKPDPVIEAIQSSGRLFVRNLPYSASEDDLRKYFEPFGALEEVWNLILLISRTLS